MKRKKFTLVIILMLFCVYSYSQTYISGGINENTAWTEENSPYIITDTTVVFGSNILTIEPGVVVKFYDDVQLRIQGSLIAQGATNDSITFTSYNSNPQMGSWGEIFLEYHAILTLEYVKMEYANKALKYGYLGTTCTIENSIFQFNNYAIWVQSGTGQSSITLNFVKFISNDVGIGYYHDEVNMTNCEFTSNRIGATLVESNVNLCLFKENTEIGLDGYTSTIQNSSFINNDIGLEQSFSGGNEASIMINNILENNTIGLRITGNFPEAIFSGNTLYNNSNYNVVNTSTYSGQDLSDNCWGTEDLDEIEYSIYHGLDDINFGVVIFTPLNQDCETGFEDLLASSDNGFFPNPARNEIIFSNNSEKAFEIYSIKGELLRKGICINKIDISQLDSGIYFLKYFSGTEFRREKLIKL